MEVLIGIRDFFFRVCLCVHARARVCVCVRARLFPWSRRFAPLMFCMRMVRRRTVALGDAPQTKKIGSGYVHASCAHDHVRNDARASVCVCVYVCEHSTRFCACPCVQQSVLCHTMYWGQWPWRAHRACPTTLRRLSDFRIRTEVKNHENSANGGTCRYTPRLHSTDTTGWASYF